MAFLYIVTSDFDIARVLEFMNTFLTSELPPTYDVNSLIERFRIQLLPDALEKAAEDKFHSMVKRQWGVSDDIARDIWMYWKETEQSNLNKYREPCYHVTSDRIPNAALLLRFEVSLYEPSHSARVMLPKIAKWAAFKRKRAAKLIQRVWRRVISDPSCQPCRNRLLREVNSLKE